MSDNKTIGLSSEGRFAPDQGTKIEQKGFESGVEKSGELVQSVERITAESIQVPKEGELGLGAATGSSSADYYQQREKNIEMVLEEGMEDIYVKLTPEKQQEFKRVGEETAKAINLVLDKTAFVLRAVIKLIKKWLSIIPGVNRFFLEQEAKIKADKILRLKK